MGKEYDDIRTMPISRDEVLANLSVNRIAYLEVNIPDIETKTYRLEECETTIGRSESASITLPLTDISRMHVKVAYQDEQFILEDLNSTNGTYVNGVNTARCILIPNDLIEIGKSRIVYLEKDVTSY